MTDMNREYLFSLMSKTTIALFKALKVRDKDTAEHSYRVAYNGYLLARHIGTTRPIDYFEAGLLHDIGKLSMPDDILKSSRILSLEERKLLINHVLDGKALLEDLGYSQVILDITKYHHERVNGEGYLGLEEKEIPLCAKLVTVVDCFDAIRFTRGYNSNCDSDDDAFKRMYKGEGQFDIYLLNEFKSLIMGEGISLSRVGG